MGAIHSGVGASADGFAWYLAEALDDAKSLAWYRKVVRELPPAIVLDALHRARDIDRRDVRRSRAALFTSIVRPLMSTNPKRYAHPPPSSS